MGNIYRFIRDIKLPDGTTYPAGEAIHVDDENSTDAVHELCKKIAAEEEAPAPKSKKKKEE